MLGESCSHKSKSILTKLCCQKFAKTSQIAVTWPWNTTTSCKSELVAMQPKCSHVTLVCVCAYVCVRACVRHFMMTRNILWRSDFWCSLAASHKQSQWGNWREVGSHSHSTAAPNQLVAKSNGGVLIGCFGTEAEIWDLLMAANSKGRMRESHIHAGEVGLAGQYWWLMGEPSSFLEGGGSQWHIGMWRGCSFLCNPQLPFPVLFFLQLKIRAAVFNLVTSRSVGL